MSKNAEEKKEDNKGTTHENIIDVIESGRKVSKDLIDNAIESLSKERKEKLTKELKIEIVRGEFTRNHSLLKLRKHRATEKPVLKVLKDQSELFGKLKNGEITIEEYKEDLEKINKEYYSECNEIDRRYANLFNAINMEAENVLGWYDIQNAKIIKD